jgi:hypothetical protein
VVNGGTLKSEHSAEIEPDGNSSETEDAVVPKRRKVGCVGLNISAHFI